MQYDPRGFSPFGSRGFYVPYDAFYRNTKPWNLTKQQRYNLSSMPIVGSILRAQDSQKWIQDYMSNRGFTWDDMKYPAIAPGSGSAFQPINAGIQLSATARFLYR